MKPAMLSRVSGFGPGAMIMTTDGELPVEWLESGDRVITRDRGAQPIQWIARSRRMGPDGLVLPPPIHLNPSRDNENCGLSHALRLSPNHRVLIRGQAVQKNVGAEEAMAKIGHLSRRGYARENWAEFSPTYTHIVTDDHDLILACGIWVETTCAETASLLSPPRHVYDACVVFGENTMAPRMCLTATEARVIRDTLPGNAPIHSMFAA